MPRGYLWPTSRIIRIVTDIYNRVQCQNNKVSVSDIHDNQCQNNMDICDDIIDTLSEYQGHLWWHPWYSVSRATARRRRQKNWPTGWLLHCLPLRPTGKTACPHSLQQHKAVWHINTKQYDTVTQSSMMQQLVSWYFEPNQPHWVILGLTQSNITQPKTLWRINM